MLFPPINQWGQMPYPIEPLSPHSTSRLAQQADTGLRSTGCSTSDELVASAGAGQAAVAPAPVVVRPVYD